MRRSLWLFPLLGTMLSVLLWHYSKLLQQQQLAIDNGRLINAITHRVNSQVLAIKLMAKRWDYYQESAFHSWQQDAKSLAFFTPPLLRSYGWIKNT